MLRIVKEFIKYREKKLNNNEISFIKRIYNKVYDRAIEGNYHGIPKYDKIHFRKVLDKNSDIPFNVFIRGNRLMGYKLILSHSSLHGTSDKMVNEKMNQESYLESTIAHEMGHIYYGHTDKKSFILFGSFILSFILLLVAFIMLLYKHYFWAGIMSAIVFIIFTTSALYLGLGGKRSIESELEADKFSYLLKYGEVRIEYFGTFISYLKERNIDETVFGNSHPTFEKRIQHLKKLIQDDKLKKDL